MKKHLIKPIKNHIGYFIHVDGHVFKTKDAKDHKLEAYRKDENGFLFVKINGKEMNLLYLMVENFMPNIKQNQQFKYSVQYGNAIPLSSIMVTDFVSEISDLHNETIHKFNCKSRAENANSRSFHKLTPVHVAECLITNDFKCVYCGDVLNQLNWHLDHFHPISKDGANKFGNIVPSCFMCNRMKSNFLATDFYKKCLKIVKNFKFKENG